MTPGWARRLWERFSIHVKLPTMFLATLMVSTLYFSGYAFKTTRDALFEAFDARLEISVAAANALLPPDFIDGLVAGERPPPETLEANAAGFRQMALASGITSVYVMIREGDLFRIVASSQVEFRTPYGDEWESLFLTERDGQPRFDTGTDEYGPSRSFVVRRLSAGGQPYFVGADISLDALVRIERDLLRHFLFVGLTSFFLVGLVSLGVARLITIPLKRLSDAIETTRLRGFDHAHELGGLLLPASARAADEVRLLARNFHLMQGELIAYLKRLSENIAARERVENEMRIAGEIQQSLLTRKPPASDRFSIYATMTPARLAGGDFYDFFLLGDGRLCFIIGDVSGKGVGAALFMTAGLTLFRHCARDAETEENNARFVTGVMARLDASLAIHNEAMRFITAIVGVLDTRTGVATLANGGHNPPLRIEAAGPTRYLELPPGGLLGVNMGATFSATEIVLAPDEGLLLYTDGVTEARQADGNFFGEERLREVAGEVAGLSSREVVDGISNILWKFSAGIELADDVTLVHLRWFGPDGRTGPERPEPPVKAPAPALP